MFGDRELIITYACCVYDFQQPRRDKLTLRLEKLKEQGIPRDEAIELVIEDKCSDEIEEARREDKMLDDHIAKVTKEYYERRTKKWSDRVRRDIEASGH